MKWSHFRRVGALGAFVFAAWGISYPARAAGGALDGKTFVADSGEQGKKAEGPKDEITFRDGKMRSSACDPYGFGDGTYTTMDHHGAVMFRARTESAKEGVIEWSGTVRGDVLDGTYVWTKAAQKPITYWMKGTLRK
jgi:hypothetical protein